MTDAGFKAVFQDKQVTIKFLNAALAGERQIKDITYLDKGDQARTVENRTIILGPVSASLGPKFILEMQGVPSTISLTEVFMLFCMVAPQGQIGKQWGNIGCYHLRSLFLEFQVAGVHRLPYGCCPS